MLNLKSTSLATLLSVSSLIAFTNPSLAETRTYTVYRIYRGIKRCGRPDENIKEARIAAEAKVRQIKSVNKVKKITLKHFKILSAETKKKHPFPSRIRCRTHLKVLVKVDVQV